MPAGVTQTDHRFTTPYKTTAVHFTTLVLVFFFWGFVAASNDILIPVFKEKLHLEQWQSQMVSLAYYVAYTVGAIVYYFISKWLKQDIISRLGYKNSIAWGLIISALGTLLFYPAAESESFLLMISGLFIVGLGFSLQQMAANPLAIVLGDPKGGAKRLSLAGGINNFGTTIGPLIVSFAIFGTLNTEGTTVASINAVKTPYLLLGLAFVVVAVIFRFSSLPGRVTAPADTSLVPPEDATLAINIKSKRSAFHYTQLSLGMIAIFVYVGVEVSTASNLPELIKHTMNLETGKIAPYISLYWASLMIGRWTASVSIFNVRPAMRRLLNVLVPYIAFVVFLLVNRIANHDITPFYIYAPVILVMIAGDFLSKGNPARQLLIFSGLAIVALLVGIIAGGMTSVFAFISVGLFCSTLWPCIFTLAIAGLGKHTNEGSSLLIMMCMGGGILSLLQGWLAKDSLLGIHYSYFVGVAGFLYLVFYAIKARSVLRSQGIDYDVAANP
ncbi:MAG: MFS transporter [Chitinophagaceae bacterium]